MKTWSFKLKSIDKNGNTYDHVVTASTSFIRDMYDRFWEFLREDCEADTFKTRSNKLYSAPLTITRNRENNTFTFTQEDSEWNFTAPRDQVELLDSECEMFSLTTPPRRGKFAPSKQQIGEYLHAIDNGDDAYISSFNAKFF